MSELAYEPIAILGIGCRFPGAIVSPRTFWDLLVEQRDATRDVPAERWSIEKFYDPNPDRIGAIYTARGGFFDEITGLDHEFFGISPREAAYVDPQHKLLLETTWEAFEDAAIPPTTWANRKVGVFVGLFTHDYENIHMRTSERGIYGPHSSTGMSTTIAANRISHAFDFVGPSMVVDTACSSSLVAVHLACRSLATGESDLAVAGGVNLQLSPEMTMALCKASMLAPDGRCKSFDARANGYARADGAGMVVLKSLAKAQADGDTIYAVILGSAVNQDGRTKGITVPNGEAQQRVMRDALACAGVQPSHISYVEAHGTGTPVGDPIEADALGTVLASDTPERTPCVIGSVKSNFGHTESAAGIAGLIKVALMQRHGRIPPNLHFEVPNPNIPWDRLRVRVPTTLEEWPADRNGRRLAGINSFGFGGTNAHVVVANAPAKPVDADNAAVADRPSLFCLSARSDEALLDCARQYSRYLRSEADPNVSLAKIASQLALGREQHSVRLAAAGRSRLEIADLLDAFVAGQRRPGVAAGKQNDATLSGLVFVCSGMGQQWWAMGRGLLNSEPVFADRIAELDRLFARLDGTWSLREVLIADEVTTQIDRTQFAQPAIFSMQVALAALWESWGVRPDMVVGHSIGEIAAACIAGVLTLEDAVTVCFHRSRLQATLAGRGGMLAVGLPASEVHQRIRGTADVSVAAVNSPKSVTLAGDIGALEQLAAEFASENVFARLLNVELPYHSSAMREISAPFKTALGNISPSRERTRLISTVTGRQIDGSTMEAEYWNRNICDPVSFAPAMQTLSDLGGRFFVEIGAHPVLAASIEECLATSGSPGVAIASLRRKQDDATTFLGAVGQLHCHGYPLEFERRLQRLSSRLDLPTYPWQRSKLWSETSQSRKIRTGTPHEGAKPDHPLLGERLDTPHPAWTNELTPHKPRYLQDHRVQGSVVFPGAGFFEMALAAANEVQSANTQVSVVRVSIETPLVLSENLQTRLQLSIGHDGHLQIHSLLQQDGDQRWARHVSGWVGSALPWREAPALDWAALCDRLPVVRDKDDIYDSLEKLGLQYGPQFRLLLTAWSNQDEAVGRLTATTEIEADAARYTIHPSLLDAAFQLLVTLPGKGTYLPVSIDRIEIFRPGISAPWAYVRRVSQSPARVVADIDLADDEGRILASVTGLTCKLFDNAESGTHSGSSTFLYETVWAEAPGTGPRTSFIPSPPLLAPTLQERHNDRNAENHRKEFIREAVPALDALATAYFIDALTAMGWEWTRRDCFTSGGLSHELRISPRHLRFVDRMLGHLADAGCLEETDDQWRVCDSPSVVPAAARWPSLILAHPDCHSELSLIHRCGSRLVEFLRDEQEPLSAIFTVGSPVAEHFYSDSPTVGPYVRIVADIVADIVRQIPAGETLRILEVGAGTGGLTSLLLPLLPAARTDYVFTDISNSFLNQAKDRFREFSFVRYGILDVERDPMSQDFSEGFFDVIVSSDAVHATADLRATLGSLHRLLAPGGMLALLEMTAPPRWCDLVFGLLPGWWAFNDFDLRPRHAMLPASAWRSVLIECGYESDAGICDQITDAESLHSIILARRPSGPVRSHAKSRLDAQSRLDPRSPVVLLADQPGVADALAAEIETLGYRTTVATLAVPAQNGKARTSTQAIMDAAPLHSPAPVVIDVRNVASPDSAADSERPSIAATIACVNLQEVVRALSEGSWQGKPDLWVVTNGTEAVDGSTAPALAQSPVRGFARVVKNEHAELNTYLADLSLRPQEIELSALAQAVVAKDDEDEIALRGGRKFVSRVVSRRNWQLADAKATAFRSCQEKGETRDRFVFRETVPPPPRPGQVQVRICATGLNFKDFARQTGLVEATFDNPGMEGAGIITAVGEGGGQWKPGDCVMGLIDGSLSNPVNTDARMLVRKPLHLSFEDAAGIPVVFLSAYQALKKQARITVGETVLIHTAAGGFGLAALQVARALGAKVLATAGNEEKRSHLRACGIEYVGDSRSGAFADEILKLTGDKGVDVVLNTLPAQMNAYNARVLRPGSGRLIDLRNMHYGAQLDYSLLKNGILFSAFDLGAIACADPDYVADLLRELLPMFEKGILRPVPYRRTPLHRISETLNAFRKAAHIGKFVVSNADSIIDIVPATAELKLRPDASYLITGGLSGFGLSTARWLADKGARHLVLTGRRGAASPEATHALIELRAAGVSVEAIAADVTDSERMRSLITRFGRDWPPLRGIVHSAMVLSDGPLKRLSFDQIRSVLAPKIDGAWTLHRLTLDQPLDFFILYSSVSALFGNRDQANYAAANEYLEALARHRREMGLPALSIAWGAIGGSGYVSRDAHVQDLFSRQGVYELGLDQAWAAVAHGMQTGASHLCAADLNWSLLRQFFRVVATSPKFGQLKAGQKSASRNDENSGVRGRADAAAFASPEDWHHHIETVVVREVSGVLGMDPQNLDLNRPLVKLGFDSLMAAELIVAIEQATGYGFSRMALLRQDVTAAELIDEVETSLSGNAPAAAHTGDQDKLGELQIEELSDSEVEGLLRELTAGELNDA